MSVAMLEKLNVFILIQNIFALRFISNVQA